MSMPMLQVDHGVNLLKIKMRSSYNSNNSDSSYIEKSTELFLCGLIQIQVKRNIYRTSSGYNHQNHQIISINLMKTFEPDQHIYAVKLTSTTLKLPQNIYYCVSNKNENWQIIHESKEVTRDFDLAFSLDLSSGNPPPNGFAYLADDTELTDFELRGVDGSIHVHKAVLAGFSPVMRSMFSGQWKETSKGAIDVASTSKETLQHLKDYMYKQILPETGIEKLAALASCYLMSDLEDRCVVKLLSTLSTVNVIELLEIAVKYNMEKFILAILENVQQGVVKVEDMKKYYYAKLKTAKENRDEYSLTFLFN